MSYSPEMLSVGTEPLPYLEEAALGTNVALCLALKRNLSFYMQSQTGQKSSELLS